MAFIIGFVGRHLSEHEAKLGRFDLVYQMGRLFEGFIIVSFWITATVLQKEKPFATDWRNGGPMSVILIMTLYLMSRFEKFRIDSAQKKAQEETATTTTAASPPA